MKMALHLGAREEIAIYFEGLAEIVGLYEEELEYKRRGVNLLGAADRPYTNITVTSRHNNGVFAFFETKSTAGK
jgi:hypothetical protein